MPARTSLISSLNGLSSPLWVLMMRTWPPHIVMAMAALSSSARPSTNAASSITRRSPGRPLERRLRGLLVKAWILWPLSKWIVYERICLSSSSITDSSIWPAAALKALAQVAQSWMKPCVISLL
ncbi:hypothetical protein D3C71_1881140 [compost metagenome]